MDNYDDELERELNAADEESAEYWKHKWSASEARAEAAERERDQLRTDKVQDTAYIRHLERERQHAIATGAWKREGPVDAQPQPTPPRKDEK